jgi:CubicO group peptidase (beta-lactamase class C family)
VSTALEGLLRRHVEAGTIPGAVAVLGSGDSVEVVAVGRAEVDGRAMREDAIMRIQSMTKPITAVAALRLVESGHLGLDRSVEEWLPELVARRVLSSPTAALDDTVPADGPITLRHLLTNSSGYGMALVPSPLQQAMADNGTEAGADPPTLDADDWLSRLSELPLAFQPGKGWRYHHSFAVLGVLLARLTGRRLEDHLAEDLFAPLAMTDTSLWVPEEKLDRLPAAYRHGDAGLVETAPDGGGFYAGPPPFDVSHGELVSTAQDFLRFAEMLANRGRVGGLQVINEDHWHQMTSDQVPASSKTADSFFPGFWTNTGWGFGLGVQTSGPQRGRSGWSGGQGTHFFVDPDETIGILLTQVELGERLAPLIDSFEALHQSPGRESRPTVGPSGEQGVDPASYVGVVGGAESSCHGVGDPPISRDAVAVATAPWVD